MKKALVCGAGGFIGGHLVKKLKREGYWVRAVDIKEHEFCPTATDEFLLLDLRDKHNCQEAHSVFAVLRRRSRTYWTVILPLLGCAFGLVLFQSVVALAEAPLGSVY